MTEQNTQVINGELTYADKVIEKIVGLALESVDGLLAVDGGFLANLKDKLVNTENVRSGVNVEVGKNRLQSICRLWLNTKNICRLSTRISRQLLSQKSSV